mmetsp:Transcript_96290/g.274314  ORF Transcript_96290/g.274314 Transcript_96290/m.274314 type:complete len:120 (+) Transcript_96290:81-440(+)
MASNQPNEVDEVIRELKLNAGFTQYAIMSNDGIVIKCEGMERTKAIQHAHLVLDLCAKSKKYIRELFEPPDNEVESLRLKTNEYEMIVAQHGNNTLVVIQDTADKEHHVGEEEEEEKKE